CRPSVDEPPAQDLNARVIQQDDHAVAALGLTVDHGLPPVPEFPIRRHSALEDDAAVPGQSRQLADSSLAAFAILDDVTLARQPGACEEFSGLYPVDLDAEVTTGPGIVTGGGWRHGGLQGACYGSGSDARTGGRATPSPRSR